MSVLTLFCNFFKSIICICFHHYRMGGGAVGQRTGEMEVCVSSARIVGLPLCTHSIGMQHAHRPAELLHNIKVPPDLDYIES